MSVTEDPSDDAVARGRTERVPFGVMLAGGNPRTLAGVTEVLTEVSSETSRLPELIDCCTAEDPIVRMRASDALEKFARRRPDLVGAQVDRLHRELAGSGQPSIQWHLAQIYGEVPLSEVQRRQAAAWLKRALDESEDWIVLTSSMSALFALAATDRDLRPALAARLHRHATGERAAVAKRASRLLAELG